MDIIKVRETVFIPDWNSVAYLCEDGKVYIELIKGRFFTKEQFLKAEEFKNMSEETKVRRTILFNELIAYFNYKS